MAVTSGRHARDRNPKRRTGGETSREKSEKTDMRTEEQMCGEDIQRL